MHRYQHKSVIALIFLLCSLSSGLAQEVEIDAVSRAGVLTFTELTNALYYRVDWSTNLSSTTWNTDAPPGVASIIATGVGSRTVTVGVTQAQSYYRVVATLSGSSTPPDMVSIPAASFVMGNATNVFSASEGSTDELPQHTITLTAFSMDRKEVTKALWDEIVNWAVLHGYDLSFGDGAGKDTTHPVQSISWYEAVKWCNARSEREGLTPCYTTNSATYLSGIDSNVACNFAANGYRLPTEAEWERAARGGVANQRFPWSGTNVITQSRANYYSYWLTGLPVYSYDAAAASGFCAPYDTGAFPYTSPVGSFAANDYGLFDMAGNVWEWCWDWYDSAYYATSPGSDPTGAATGSMRVLRGGSWGFYASGARVADRDADFPINEGFYDAGFRCVRRP